MKNILFFISMLAMTIGFVACSNDDDLEKQTPSQNEKMIITACMDDEITRTSLDGNSVVWSAGDKIILKRQSKSYEYILVGGAGTTTGTFAGDKLDDATYSAYYGDLLVSSSQFYDDKKIARVPMYAKVVVKDGKAENVSFKNLCGLLRLRLSSNFAATVKSITVSATSVAGTVSVSTQGYNDSWTGRQMGDLLGISLTNPSNSIVYSCGDNGIKLASTGTDFYIVMPAKMSNTADQTNSFSGVKIKVLTVDGKSIVKTLASGKTLDIDRSKITPVSFALTTGTTENHTAVDLGLSVLWANMNIGATTDTGAGNYYAWGEVAPKARYDWETYSWGTSTNISKYNSADEMVLSSEDDAAEVNWGNGWRMPTVAEWEELMSNCTWTLKTSDYYYTIKGPNGNEIKLPCVGYYQNATQTYGDANVSKRTSNLYYWSSSLYKKITTDSDGNDVIDFFDFQYGQNFFTQTVAGKGMNYILRSCGLPIRPVKNNPNYNANQNK